LDDEPAVRLERGPSCVLEDSLRPRPGPLPDQEVGEGLRAHGRPPGSEDQVSKYPVPSTQYAVPSPNNSIEHPDSSAGCVLGTGYCVLGTRWWALRTLYCVLGTGYCVLSIHEHELVEVQDHPAGVRQPVLLRIRGQRVALDSRRLPAE